MILIELVVLAMWCLGIRIATDEGMILHRVDALLCDHLPEWAYKPIIGCVYCMASVHGIAIHLFFYYAFGADLVWLPIVCVCGVAVNGFATNLFDLSNKQ